MLTKKQLEKAGYKVLPIGGWFVVDPTLIPHDWKTICKSFDADPKCKELVLCISGVKEIHEGEEE